MGAKRSDGEGRVMRRLTYWWDISWVLVLKVIGITLLYFLFFAAPKPPEHTAAAVAQHVLVMKTPPLGGKWGL